MFCKEFECFHWELAKCPEAMTEYVSNLSWPRDTPSTAPEAPASRQVGWSKWMVTYNNDSGHHGHSNIINITGSAMLMKLKQIKKNLTQARNDKNS